DPEHGRELRTLQAHQASVSGLAWSPDGQVLAAAHGFSVIFWDAVSGKGLRTLSRNVFRLAWSPDGRTRATMGPGGIRLWPGTLGALLDQVRHDIRLFTPSEAECQQYFGSDTCPPIK